MIIKCRDCGLSSDKAESKIEAVKDLSKKGCTIAIGFRSWCKCGAKDSFDVIEDKD